MSMKTFYITQSTVYILLAGEFLYCRRYEYEHTHAGVLIIEFVLALQATLCLQEIKKISIEIKRM